MLIAKKANENLEDRAARLEKLKNSRGKLKPLKTVKEHDLRLQQMKKAMNLKESQRNITR
jgi:hypothetical protein